MSTYQDFLAEKAQIGGNSGFAPVFLPDFLFELNPTYYSQAVKNLAEVGNHTDQELISVEEAP